MPKLKVHISSTYKDLVARWAMLFDFIDGEAGNDFETARIMAHKYDEGKSELSLADCVNEIARSGVYILTPVDAAGSECLSIHQKNYSKFEYGTTMETGMPVYRFLCYSAEVVEKDKNGHQLIKAKGPLSGPGKKK